MKNRVMLTIAQKRIIKDIGILEKNKVELHSRGVFWHFNEENIKSGAFLIIPKHKEANPQFTSPYTNGIFLFELDIPDDFPLSPPRLTFNPKQNKYRLHPNYYEYGKVCLSVINTWSGNDWTPSMSLMSIVNIVEERFNENSLRFEPGHEQDSDDKIIFFNKIIRYGVADVAICAVFENKYKEYAIFRDVIKEYWDVDFIKKVEKLAQDNPNTINMKQDSYNHFVGINWTGLYERLKESYTNFMAQPREQAEPPSQRVDVGQSSNP
jgi:ubiquitin-protein ligase